MSGARKRRKPRSPEGKKIATLVREGEPQNRAVAIAMSMKRAHRLTPSGGYKRVKKSKRRSHKQ